MKKIYSKPALYAERFQLATHIADCSGEPGASTIADPAHCGYRFGAQYVFNSGVLDCELIIEAEDYGTDCYNGNFGELSGQPFGS